MKKPTKLIEKSVQMPDTRETQWREDLRSYLREVQDLQKESALSFRFGLLVQALLGTEPGFIEAYVRTDRSSRSLIRQIIA